MQPMDRMYNGAVHNREDPMTAPQWPVPNRASQIGDIQPPYAGEFEKLVIVNLCFQLLYAPEHDSSLKHNYDDSRSPNFVSQTNKQTNRKKTTRKQIRHAKPPSTRIQKKEINADIFR